MNTKGLLSLNMTNADDEIFIKKALTRVSWLEGKNSDLKTLESLCKMIKKKYKLGIGYITPASENSMSCMVKDYNTHEWIDTFYFITSWECMAKLTILLYSYLKNKK